MSQKRSMEQIQQEYQGLCLRAGDIQYRLSVMAKDLEEINKQLRDLNLEAASVKAEEAKASEEKKEG